MNSAVQRRVTRAVTEVTAEPASNRHDLMRTAFMFRLKTWILALGLFFTETFILCVFWNLIAPNPVYIRMLETVLPGFRWLTLRHMVLGMIESFLYGTYIAVAFVPLFNFLHRRHEREARIRESARNADR